MEELLIYLLKKQAHITPCKMTTSEIATELNLSQQSVSRKLILLEKEGYVERSGGQTKLSKKAYEELSSFYGSLKRIFERTPIEISGSITTGFGEGRYYLSIPGYRNQIIEKLGFDPYFGTLNLVIAEKELWKRQALLQLDPIIISGFRDGQRTYGDLFAYRCKLENNDCAIILPLRTHHNTSIIEIIAPFNIREKFNKKDGSLLKVLI